MPNNCWPKFKNVWIRWIIGLSMVDCTVNLIFVLLAYFTGIHSSMTVAKHCNVLVLRTFLNFGAFLIDVCFLLCVEKVLKFSPKLLAVVSYVVNVFRFVLNMADIDSAILKEPGVLTVVTIFTVACQSVFSFRIHWAMLFLDVKPFGKICGIKVSTYLNVHILNGIYVTGLSIWKLFSDAKLEKGAFDKWGDFATALARILSFVCYAYQVIYGLRKNSPSLLRMNYYFRLFYFPVAHGIFYTWSGLHVEGDLLLRSCESFHFRKFVAGVIGIYAALFNSLIYNYSIFMESESHHSKKSERNITVISEKNLRVEKNSHIGGGHFSKVSSGVLKRRLFFWKKIWVPVAVKFFHRGMDKDAIFEEIRNVSRGMFLKKQHPNIVRTFGVCFLQEEDLSRPTVNIIMELCIGNVKNYIKSGKPLGSNQHCLCEWSLQIAEGMSYLESHNLIHGDLAARNVLLDSFLVAKVSDFGMSRKLYGCKTYVQSNAGVFPWKWMAPESLQYFKFSVKSDVWSYGVLLWEMFSLGKTPFEFEEWNSEFALKLENGLRLEKLETLRGEREMFGNLMTKCWDIIPDQRPSFKEIKSLIKMNSKACKACVV